MYEVEMELLARLTYTGTCDSEATFFYIPRFSRGPVCCEYSLISQVRIVNFTNFKMYCNVSMLSILIANDNTISHKIYTCAKHFFTPASCMKRDNLYLKRLNYCISILPASSDTKMDALID